MKTHPQRLGSAGPKWGPRSHISPKLPGDATLLVLDHTVSKEGLESLLHPEEAADALSDHCPDLGFRKYSPYSGSPCSADCQVLPPPPEPTYSCLPWERRSPGGLGALSTP